MERVDPGSARALDASIVIPTHNRRDVLMATLSEIEAMDYPADLWEVIVVDDGSSDGTARAVREWMARAGVRARLVEQPNSGPAAARNNGAALSTARYLIFVDNDILVYPDFVSSHVGTLDANPGCWVIGRILHPPQLRTTPFGRYRDLLWESFHRDHAEALSVTGGITAANLSLPAEDFRRLGGFDESFTIASSEDWDLGMRGRQSGIRVLYNSAIRVIHNDWAVSLERFCERQRLYSLSDVLLWEKYGDASPRAELVQENSRILLGEDSARVIGRKAIKRILSTSLMRRSLLRICAWLERVFPDSQVTRRFYEIAIGVFIFLGVRQGLAVYGVGQRSRKGEGSDGL